MRMLNNIGIAWRNYLFANNDVMNNDVDDFIVRVEIIRDSQEQLLETMLEDNPNMELVRECKEEIAFQKTYLEDMISEFYEYYSEDIHDLKQISVKDILNDICNTVTRCSLYEIAIDWKDWGVKAHKICDKLNDIYGYKLNHIHDNLCKLFFDEIYKGNSNQDFTKLDVKEK